MTVETANYISQLDPSYPSNSDFLSEGDNHITMIKDVLKNSLKTTAGKQYDLDAIEGAALNYPVPIGAIVMWYGAVADIPTGWAICNGSIHSRTDGAGNITTPNLSGRFIRGATSDTFQNTEGGKDSKQYTVSLNGDHTHSNPNTSAAGDHDHGGSTLNHTLTIAQIPWHDHGGGWHNHNVKYVDEANTPGIYGSWIVGDGAVSSSPPLQNEASYGPSEQVIDGQGGGGGHSHGIAGSGDHTHTIGNTGTGGAHNHTVTVDHLPTYRNMIWIMKI
jgi:hypothetical protein